MHRDRRELIDDPLKQGIVLEFHLHAAVGGDADCPLKGTIVDVAGNFGVEAGKIGPHGSGRQRRLEQLDRLGVGPLARQRPIERQRGKFAHLLVGLPSVLAWRGVDVANVDRVDAGRLGHERCPALGVTLDLFLRQIRVNDGEHRVGHGLARQQCRQSQLLVVEMGYDLQPRSARLEAVKLLGLARDGLRVVTQQERRLQRARQHAVVELADDHQRTIDGQVRAQPIVELSHFERVEFARRLLDFEHRRGHFVDEARIARGGHFAEIDLGRAASFGWWPDAHEQKMCLRRRRRQRQYDEARQQAQALHRAHLRKQTTRNRFLTGHLTPRRALWRHRPNTRQATAVAISASVFGSGTPLMITSSMISSVVKFDMP